MGKEIVLAVAELLPVILDLIGDLTKAKDGDDDAANRVKRKLEAELMRQGNAAKEKALFG